MTQSHPLLVDSINRANNVQMSLSSAISWVIAVLFAYWINRGWCSAHRVRERC